MFNGEIYNYQSLREDLLKAGHVFTTKTDSEVLLHGFEEYGTDLLNKLRGMFAVLLCKNAGHVDVRQRDQELCGTPAL